MALYTKLLLFVVYNSGKQAKTVENENIDKCLLWNEKGNVVEAPEIKKAGHPVWLAGCQECEACINLCPTGAIQYGRQTAGKRRYRHPAVRTGELAVQGQD
jgi:ferredoxin